MSEKKSRFDVPVRLFRYCLSCADHYGLPAGGGNRLPNPARCELCGGTGVRYFSDRTLTALVLGVDVDAIIEERVSRN